AMAVREGLSLDTIRLLAQSESMEAALNRLEAQDSQLAKQLWDRLAAVVEQRSADYISRYGSWSMTIGSALFDRQRRLRWAGPLGVQQLTVLGVIPEALH
ncbi:MAG: cobalt-precorrin-5B (C(1))-methyltransferase, partial [Prochlorococcus sp.]|nr:cobalt-precorrin-5B (C(1))-methyltransferase [Prochlorococcus sp.]